MAYKRNVKRAYGQRAKIRHTALSPVHHLNFRNEWEANFDRAIAEAYALKKQGYLVDEAIERGALTQSQANRLIKRLQELGCESQTIPVATWAGEKVVFIVYKPPKEPQPSREAEPKPERKSQMPPEKLAERFVNQFFRQEDDPKEAWDKLKTDGYMLDPPHYVAFISKHSQSQDPLVTQLKQLTNPIKTFRNGEAIYKALRKGERAGLTTITFGPNNTMSVGIENVRRALKVLSSGEIRVYCGGDEKPVYFVDETENAVAVAPRSEDSLARKASFDIVVTTIK